MTIKRLTVFIPIATIVILSAVLVLGQGKRRLSSIRSVDFRNIELSRAPTDNMPNERSPVRFRNGGFETDRFRYSLMRIAYGDLNGDGLEEAALLIRAESKTTTIGHDEIYIVSLENGVSTIYAKFSPTEPTGYVLSIPALGSTFEIENELLTIDVAYPENHQPPRRCSTVTYRIGLNSVQIVRRSRLREIPENMREIG
jgi:hypothetical protein